MELKDSNSLIDDILKKYVDETSVQHNAIHLLDHTEKIALPLSVVKSAMLELISKINDND